MHVIKTFAAAFALAATVSAFPLQKRQDDSAIGDPNRGLRGGLDFLSIPSGDGASSKAKRAEDIPDAANPVVDLAENVKGGFEGFFDFLGASGSDDK
ncbi:unnamed protein product [Aureobasidium mustum]|uniref:Uncharacterized protein n=1 Tax=Aureobasidium mustum TaxID=2773714 RepID=A0A9N8P8T0_9PEZI|nr:unnamed protein product [Aureobasidium mustum]